MQDPLPKTTEIFAHLLKSFDVLDCLIASVNLRVEAEDAYQKALLRSVQKLNDVQTDHPLYSKLIKSFKGLSSERIHQVRFFKQQIAKESEILKTAILNIEVNMKNELNDVKTLEKELRAYFDKMVKSKSTVQQKIKQLDEKFVLNELGMLHKLNKNGRKASEGIVSEQQQLIKEFQGYSFKFKEEAKKFQELTLEKEKKICEYDIKIEEQFVDFIKKFNVHEISLIRNIQYDIDNMIKKTDIFNWQNTKQFKSQISLKGLDNLKTKLQNPYQQIKFNILKEQQILKERQKLQASEQEFIELKKQFSTKQTSQAYLQEIKKDYKKYKGVLFQFIESFRKAHQAKFTEQEYKVISFLFKQIFQIAHHENDLEGIQKILIFSNTYYCPAYPPLNKKRTIFEDIRSEKFLKEVGFWKFYLYFCIKQALIGCLKFKEDERDIHMSNGVYSTLLSNSLTMIDCGIEKHNIKNLVGKMAKSYGGLTEVQLGQLLKVIQTGYETYEKNKKLQAEKLKSAKAIQ